MNQRLQDKLYEKYPKIFGQKDLDMMQTAMCWGIDCGDGWYNIIDTLCWHIQHEVDKPHEDIERFTEYLEDPDLPEATVTYFQQQIIEIRKRIIPQVEATQVKEKYGGLRFYVFGGDDKIDALISFAESMSECTCEECGRPGTQNVGGWIRTLCDICRGGQNEQI